MRAVALLVVTLGAACRPDDPNVLARDDFAGVRGRLYMIDDPCCGTYPAGDCPAAVPTDGIVRAIAVDGTVAEVRAIAATDFELRLPAGSYTIELAPSVAAVDRTIGPLTIEIDEGWRIERTYRSQFAAGEIILAFPATSESVINDLLAAEGMTALGEFGDDPLWIYARLPAGRHPELEGARLVAAYPAVIVSFDENSWSCPGGS